VDSLEALQALHEVGGLGDVFSRVPAQQIAKALDAFASLSLATVPVSNNGMVTPPRMTTPMPTDDNVEMASPSETPRTRLGGDDGSLEEKEEKAASPDTPVPAQGDAPKPPEPVELTEPHADSVAQQPEPSLEGTPASSSPPVALKRIDSWEQMLLDDEEWQKQQRAELEQWRQDQGEQQKWQEWERQQQQRQPWTNPPGKKPDAKLPHDSCYSEKTWKGLETYDRWLRGKPFMACVYGKPILNVHETDKWGNPVNAMGECDIEQNGWDVCDACVVNRILGRALIGPDFNWDSCWWDKKLNRWVPGIDVRCPIESQFKAFAKYGCPTPPRTAEIRDLMLGAAKHDLKSERAFIESLPKSLRREALNDGRFAMTAKSALGLGLDDDKNTDYEDANHKISVDKQDQEPNKYEYCSDEMSDTGADA
jgi:hypothetical protein